MPKICHFFKGATCSKPSFWVSSRHCSVLKWLYLKGNRLGGGGIFHFHVYGRKGKYNVKRTTVKKKLQDEMSKICMRNCIVDQKNWRKIWRAREVWKNKHVRLREPQHTPVEHSSGIPKAPKMKGIPTHGVGGFFFRYVPTGLLESS